MSGLKSRLPSGSTSRRSPELVPAAAAVVLLLAAVTQLAMPSGASVPELTRRVAARPGAVAARPAMQVYGAVMAHPIFAPDRAPPPAEADASGNLSGVEVLGTAIAGKNAAAALLRDSDGTFSRVKVGEEIEGWKLVSIAPTELVFDRNGERRSLNVDAARLRSQATTGPKNAAQAPIAESTDDEDDSDDSDDE